MREGTSEGLIRDVRRWDLVAMVVNGIVGASIFALPSKVFSLTGTYSTQRDYNLRRLSRLMWTR